MDYPENILRKTLRTKSQISSRFLHRANSLPEKFVAFQDIQFDLHFEKSLFKTKSKNWKDHIIFDPSILPKSPVKELSSQIESDLHLLQHFHTLQDLVTDLTSEIDDGYLQHLVEFTTLNILASSFTSQPAHIQSPTFIASIIPTPSFILQHKVTQIL